MNGAAALLLYIPLALSQDEPITRVTVREVRVDAIVTDAHGNSVAGLTGEDFRVFQDGKLRSPLHVQYVAGTAAAPHPGTKTDVERSIVFIVDDANIAFENFVHARRAIQQYVETGKKPGDVVSVLTTSHSSSFLDQFTSDPSRLLLATKLLRFQPSPGTTFPLVLTLGRALQTLSQMPGRKSIVLFCSLMPSDVQMLEHYQRLADLALRSSVRIYGVNMRGLYASPIPFSPNALVETLREEPPSPALPLIAPTDKGSASLSGPKLDDSTGLFFLANETGGYLIENSNAIGEQLRKVVADQSNYYLISWPPGEEAFVNHKGSADYHKIRIEIARAGLKIRTFHGYYGVTGSGAGHAPRSPKAAMQEALLSPYRGHQTDLKLTSEFVLQDGRGYIRSFLNIDGKSIVFTPHPEDGRTDCYAINLELLTQPKPADSEMEFVAESQIVSLGVCGLTHDKILQDGLAVTMMHPVKKAGEYEMQVAVRNISGDLSQAAASLPNTPRTLMTREDLDPQVGSAHQLVNVPDWSREPSLFGLSLQVAATSVATSQPRTGSEPESAVRLSYRPGVDGDPAVRRFHKGDTLRYEAGLANLKDVSVAVRMIRNDTGEMVEVPATARDGKISGEFTVGSELGEGGHSFQLSITGKGPNGRSYQAVRVLDLEVLN